ncbi:unnamed protein product, partial [Amoebophrya sp. A25]
MLRTETGCRVVQSGEQSLAALLWLFQEGDYFGVLNALRVSSASQRGELQDVGKQQENLLEAICCLQIFLQANVTGPELGQEELDYYEREEWTTARPALPDVDGESIYDGIKVPKLLQRSYDILSKLCLMQSGSSTGSTTSLLKSARVWLARVAFAWQRALAEASDRGSGHSITLQRIAIWD